MSITGFDSVHVLNLERRPDRLEAFWKDFPAAGWPFATPHRFEAIDGTTFPKPVGFTQQNGAWGCLQSHMTMWQQAIDKKENLFIFEDDCVFRDDFAVRLVPFLQDVPDDWDMVYLGGLHHFRTADQPQRVTDRCYRAWGVTGTWSYAISIRFLPTLLAWFTGRPMAKMHHLDQMLAEYHVDHRPRVYLPYPWLCGMSAGQSDICTRNYMAPSWWDWKPDADFDHHYIAVDKVSVGDGPFKSGFDPHFADNFQLMQS